MSEIIQLANDTFIVPGKQSPCNAWQHYYNQLKKAFGKQFAASAWLMTWQKNGSQFCTTDAAFNKWLAANKIDVSTAATRAVADLSDIGSNILGTGKSLSGVVAALPKILLFGGVSLLLLFIYLVFNSIKNQQFSLSDIGSLHPTALIAKSIQ